MGHIVDDLTLRKQILDFIEDFKSFDKDNVLLNTFTKGYCYYFAVILMERFGGIILYDYLDGHFVIMIRHRIYDITGDVTNKYNDITKLYQEREWSNILSIVDGCILKTR